jgi:hypothetical protein
LVKVGAAAVRLPHLHRLLLRRLRPLHPLRVRLLPRRLLRVLLRRNRRPLIIGQKG